MENAYLKTQSVKIAAIIAAKPAVQVIANLLVGPLIDRIGYSVPMFCGVIVICTTATSKLVVWRFQGMPKHCCKVMWNAIVIFMTRHGLLVGQFIFEQITFVTRVDLNLLDNISGSIRAEWIDWVGVSWRYSNKVLEMSLQ